MAAAWDWWDEFCMGRALQLAALGEGRVEPNPLVGCVISKHGRIIAEGYHERFGGSHAERGALAQAGEAAADATLYVTLEPCCHYGKTPPCTQAILAARVQRVVVACEDPFPAVQGQGIAQLRQAGIRVEVGLSRDKAEQLLAPYLTRLRDGRPWVIAKYAMTWDGKIATAAGESRWISGPAARQQVQRLRGRVDAIAVGRGTVSRDNPLLLAQPPGPRLATRIVFSSHAQVPMDSRLLQTLDQAPVLVVAAEDAPPENVQALQTRGCQVWLGPVDPVARLRRFLRYLADTGATNVLVEGGSRLLGTFWDAQLIDEVHLFVCPKLFGGQLAPSPIAGTGIHSLADHCRLTVQRAMWLESDWYAIARTVRNAPQWYIEPSSRGTNPVEDDATEDQADTDLA